MKFEITSRWTGSVLFSLKTDSLKLAVQAAVNQKAALRGAAMCGANLCEADLCGAKNLERFPISILGHKHGLFTTMDGKLAIGCHTYGFDTWLRHAEEVGEKEGYSPLDIEIYKLHIAHIQKVSQLLWNAKKEEKAEVVKAS